MHIHYIGMRQPLGFFGFLLQAEQGQLPGAEIFVDHFYRQPGLRIAGLHLT